MSLNPEQTAKLRTLVKAKLVELGEYVDDQLTDYVIIMVTNRKSEKQMADDLELFLGGIENSTNFSAWLHQTIKNLIAESSAQVSSYKKQTSKTRQTSTADELAIQIESNEFNEEMHQQQTANYQSATTSDQQQQQQQQHTLSRKSMKHHQVPQFNPTPLITKPIYSCIGAVINHEQQQRGSGGGGNGNGNNDDDDVELNGGPSIANSHRRATTRRRSANSSPPPARNRSRSRSRDDLDRDRRRRQPAKGDTASAKSSLNMMLKAVNDANKSVVTTSATTTSTTTTTKKSIADEKLEEIRAKRRQAVAEQVAGLDPSIGKRLSFPDDNRTKRLRTNTNRPWSIDSEPSSTGISSRDKPLQQQQQQRKVVRLVERREAASVRSKTISDSKPDEKVKEGGEDIDDDDDDDDDDDGGIRIELNSNGANNQFQQREIDSGEQLQQQQQQQQQQLQQQDQASTVAAPTQTSGQDTKFIVTLTGVDEARFQRAVVAASSRRGLFDDGGVNDDELIYEGEAGYDDDYDMDDTANQQLPFNPSFSGGDELMEQDYAMMMMNSGGGGEADAASSLRQQQSVKKKLIRCAYWPSCDKGEQCPYLHPSKPCTMFPNCPFGVKCHYVHPVCRYDGFCTRLDCPYTHHINNKKTESTAAPSGGETPTTTSKPAVAPTAPISKITINKIKQPFYSLVNTATSGQQTSTSTAATAPLQDIQMTSATNIVKPASYFPKPIQSSFIPAATAAAASAALPNQYTLINRTNTVATIPIHCKYGNLCKNAKCMYTHTTLPQKSQLKWVAPSSTTPTKSSTNVFSSSLESTSTSIVNEQPQQQQQLINQVTALNG